MKKLKSFVKGKFFKQFRSYAFYSLLSSIVGFATIPYLTRTLTPEEFGVVGMFQVALFLAVPLISLQSSGLLGINRVQMTKRRYNFFLGQYMSLGFVIFLCSLVVPVALYSVSNMWWLLAFLTLVIALVRFLGDLKKVELVQDSKSAVFGRLTLVISLTTLLFTVVFIETTVWSWEARISAILFAEVTVLGIFFYYFDTSWNRLHFFLTGKFIKEIFRFGLPLLLAIGAGWLINQADRLIVLHYFTLKEVGVYTAAYMIGFSINTVNTILVNTVVPKVYQALENKDGLVLVKKYHKWYSILIILLGAILGCIFFFWSGLILGEAYADAGIIIATVALSFGFSGAYRVPGLVLDFYKLNVLKMKLLYVCAFLNILLSLLLIPVLGILAPALGTLLAYIVLSILVYYFAIKEMCVREDVAAC